VKIVIKTFGTFYLFIITTIIATYYLPTGFSTAWYVIILFFYWYSRDEAFWFAFFLVISDGFLGFFGLYETTIHLFPGLPAIELSQFYIILSVFKARFEKPTYSLFFKNMLNVMGVYLIILIILGIGVGLKSMLSEYLRVIKLTLPFLLFYSFPRLMKSSDEFYKIFKLLFPITILALVAQIFEIVNLQPLSNFLGARDFEEIIYAEDEAVRSFYNTGIVLLTMFGSLYYFSKKQKSFPDIYMNLLTIIAFSIAFLSATRGWILGFGITIILFIVVNVKLNLKRLVGIISMVFIVFFFLMRFPVVGHQVVNAFDRFVTVGKVVEGDNSVDDFQIRSTIRGPRVIKKWRESPVLGFGFSDEYRKYMDCHVGNQNILLHSGIIGYGLMMIFFLKFIGKIIQTSVKTNDNSLIIFVVFFIGWFFIHSTSGQHFSYEQIPSSILPQVLIFCFGAFCVAEAENKIVLQE
jgi:hypothetical protein